MKLFKKIIGLSLILITAITLIACATDTEINEVIVEGPRYSQVRVTTGQGRGEVNLFVQARNTQASIHWALMADEVTEMTTEEVMEPTDAIHSGVANGVLNQTITELDDESYFNLFVFVTLNDIDSEVLKFNVRTMSEIESMIRGLGTEEDPFLIETAWQLAAITTNNFGYTDLAHYRLVADICLADWGNWTPIGLQYGNARRIRGSFDGNGHTISNVTIESDNGNERLGIFRELAEDAWIGNLYIDNINIAYNGSRIGALVGMSRGHIFNIHVTNGNIVQTDNSDAQVGGVVGAMFDEGMLINASFQGDIVARGRRVGGVVGTATTAANNENIFLSNLYFRGTVLSEYRQVGGVVGLLSGATLSIAVAEGTVTGVNNVGGVVGMLETRDVVGAPRPRLEQVIFTGAYVRTITSDLVLPTVQIRAGMIFGNHSARGMDINWTSLYVIETAEVRFTTAGTVTWPSEDPGFPEPGSANLTNPGNPLAVAAGFNGTIVTTQSLATASWYQENVFGFNVTQVWDIATGLPRLPRVHGGN